MESKEDKKKRLYSDGCPYCGYSFTPHGTHMFTWQHIWPRRRNGPDISENMKPCCSGCNTDMESAFVDDCPAALECYRSIVNADIGKLSSALGHIDTLNLSGKARKLMRKKKKILKNTLL